MVESIVWWVTLQLLGLAALPIAAVVLRALPDRGYALSKALGLLLTGWLAYTVAMTGVIPFGRLLVLVCLLLVAAFSAFLLYRNDRALLTDLRDHFTRSGTLRYVIVCEVLFTVAFALWAVVRAYNPNIVDQEKFMDFGFLNSILNSPSFPPNDMWLSGFSINYYYFGYVLMAAVTSLSGVATPIAFNLSVVTLFALTALGAFSIVHNVIATRLLIRTARASRAEPVEAPVEAPVETTAAEPAAASTVPQRRSRNAPASQPAEPDPAVPVRRARAQASAATAPTPTTVATEVRPSTRRVAAKPAADANGADGTGNGHAAAGGVEETREAPPATRTPAYLPVGEGGPDRRWVPWFLSPYLYGVLAALMVVVMGNLIAPFAVKAGFDDAATLEGNGFRFCFLCNQADSFYWFGPSRVIQDYRTTQPPGPSMPSVKEKVGFETINEFPAFSFVLADLHPHVLLLPFVLLAVAAALALIRRRVLRATSWRDGIPSDVGGWLTLTIVALIAGTLYTGNTWDFPTYLGVILLSLAVPYLGFGRRGGRGGWGWLRPLVVQALIIGVLAIVLFLPFHLTFKSLVGGEQVTIPENLANIPLLGWILQKLGSFVLINTADKTILGFLVIFGIFLSAILVWLGYEFYTYLRRRSQVLEHPQRSLYLWGGFFLLTFVVALLLRFPLFALLVPVVAVSAAMIWHEPRRPERNFALILVGLAALIAVTIEVVFLRDNFQMRMNTLFKFYFQIWVMWALAAGYGLWRVLYSAFEERRDPIYINRERYDVYGASTPVRVLAGVWGVAVVLLIVAGMTYTYYAVIARQVVAGGRTLQGLDGTAWLGTTDNGRYAGDLATIEWLKQNATGRDTVLEAGGAEYEWAGRISSYSGIPTLVAWDNSHEALWRTNQPDAREQISARRNLVNNIYQGADPNGGALTAERLTELLNQYGVDYVVVGPIERGARATRPNEQVTPYAESLFKYALTEAFTSGETTLYRVGQTPAANGTVPTTPVPGTTPGVTPPPQADPNVAPVGLFDVAPSGVNRGQLNLPRGITRDAQGNFYVVDTQNQRIQKFDSTGKWVSMFGSKGNGDGQFNAFSDTADGTGPGGIAVDAQGNIYVADTWNHRIQKFDSSGKFVTKWGEFVSLADAAGAADPNSNSKFYGPRGIAVGPDGNVYVTDTGNKRVSIFDANGTFLREISSGITPDKVTQNYPFSQPGEMNEPIGIVVGKQGNVYVADALNHRIQKFDNTGKFAAQWPIAPPNWDPGPYLEPFLGLDDAGNVYASAPTGKTVLKFGADGNLLGQKNSDGKTTLTLPTGIFADPDGTVYVVDTTGNAVLNLGQIP